MPEKPRHEGLIRAGELLPEILPADLFEGIIRPEDVRYTHPVFMQCFLPVRHTERNAQRWQANCGRASLVVRAGELADPARPHEFESRVVPAGPKARFVVGYINDYIQRHDTPTVNLGDSLRLAMQKLNIPVGGRNGAALTAEVKNFAAAEVTLTAWYENQVEQQGGRVAPRLRFWLEKDPRQRTIWQPEMTVSNEYFAAVRDGNRLAPVYWPAILALQHDTRAMDIHCFLTYRLHSSLERPVSLHVKVLHAMFGQDIRSPKKFWESFRTSLQAALKWYPAARVEIKNDCLILKDSPPLIPYRKQLRLPL